VAAAAEEHDLTVVHYDADFDLIASVTGQRCQMNRPGRQRRLTTARSTTVRMTP